MRDKIIISTISKTYFIIVSLFMFIFFAFSIFFIVLQNGLYLDSLSLPNLKIKQLYIKWNENLDISIKEIHIKNTRDKEDSKIELNDIATYIQKIPHFYNILERISIDKIFIDNIEASFVYEKGHDGFLSASSPLFETDATLSFRADLLDIKINNYTDNKRDVNLNGNIILNPKTKSITSSLFINIHNDISLNILLYANESKLYYKAISLKEIQSISYLMQELNLNKDIKYWAYEAIDFSSLSLHDIYGWADFKNLADAYKNIYVSATGHKLNYAYNKDLDSIHTQKTDLEFKDGILLIYPREATTYKSKLGKSWIKIDFTKKEELLTLKLLFDGKLDKDTLGILEAYKIKIPFLQNTGKTKVDLTLEVGLRNISIDAQGVFFTKTANFRYHGFDIDIFNTSIQLDNYNVSIKDMLVQYQDLLQAKVDVVYDANTSNGEIDLNIDSIDIKKVKVSLDNKKPLKVKYTISPNTDMLSIEKSQWNVNNYNFNVDALELPFNLETLKVKIPRTQIFSKDLLKVDVSGVLDLNTFKTTLDMNLKDIYFGDIKLNKRNNLITLKYDDALFVQTKEILHFRLNSEKSFLNPTKVTFKEDTLVLDHTYINIGNMLKTKLYAEYNFNSNKGFLDTRRARFSTKELGLLYFNKEVARFDIKHTKNQTNIYSKELDIAFVDTPDIWSVHLKSFRLLSLRSEFMKKYHLKNGSIFLSKKHSHKDIDVLINIIYPYKIFVQNNIPTEKYILKGKFNTSDNSLHAKINKNISLTIDNSVTIDLNNIGINVNAAIDLTNSLDDNKPTKPSDLQVFINAHDSYLFLSKDRRALARHIYLYYENHVLSAGLLHKEGVASLKYENEKFNAYGEKFNDEFMENLFAFSDFKGGEFKFNISGSLKKYEGIFTIDDTIIIDYKLLNNVLAFVNTIPALITFSTPGYNAKGLHLETAYMKFQSQSDIFTMSDVYFHSKELDILGKGTANFRKNEIDLALKLKTDIGSSAAKIPVLGYLFLDGDSLSSTLSVTSPLNDPKISTLIGKEIVVAPLNLLLRTLTLPYYYLVTKDDNNTKASTEDLLVP